MKYGIFVTCYYKGGHAPEPEGNVIFDHYPKIGDRKILSDGKIWEVFQVYENLHCDMKLVETGEDNEAQQ